MAVSDDLIGVTCSQLGFQASGDDSSKHQCSRSQHFNDFDLLASLKIKTQLSDTWRASRAFTVSSAKLENFRN